MGLVLILFVCVGSHINSISFCASLNASPAQIITFQLCWPGGIPSTVVTPAVRGHRGLVVSPITPSDLVSLGYFMHRLGPELWRHPSWRASVTGSGGSQISGPRLGSRRTGHLEGGTTELLHLDLSASGLPQ